MVLEMWYNILKICYLAKIGRTFYILEIFTQVDGITFKLFVHYSNYSNSWVRIALFGIRIRSFFRNRIYSVFSIRCIFKNQIYSVFDIRSNFTIRDNTGTFIWRQIGGPKVSLVNILFSVRHFALYLSLACCQESRNH